MCYGVCFKDIVYVYDFIFGVEIIFILYFFIKLCLDDFFWGKKFLGVWLCYIWLFSMLMYYVIWIVYKLLMWILVDWSYYGYNLVIGVD